MCGSFELFSPFFSRVSSLQKSSWWRKSVRQDAIKERIRLCPAVVLVTMHSITNSPYSLPFGTHGRGYATLYGYEGEQNADFTLDISLCALSTKSFGVRRQANGAPTYWWVFLFVGTKISSIISFIRFNFPLLWTFETGRHTLQNQIEQSNTFYHLESRTSCLN